MKTDPGPEPLRIAMWSGPRNISTALMRAWENRPDTVVTDEPFYAYYLSWSGRMHPGRDEVLASQSSDWREVVEQLNAPLPPGLRIHYQKHMTHHIDRSVSLGWLAGLRNCFLIRRPRNMLASLLRVLPDARLADTGLEQQRRLFDAVCDRLGEAPPVVDSADVLRDPAGVLRALCDSVGVGFSERMLGWPAGRRDSDGVWAPYWYDAVEESTGFAAYRHSTPAIPAEHEPLLARCEALYAEMAAHRLRPTA